MEGTQSQDETGATARTAALHERPLDGEERDRLAALRAATEPNAPHYAAILSVLATARDRYEIEMRTEQIAESLAAAGIELDNLDSALEQLRQWGNVTWTQDTTRVSRLEDFRRRRALWQLSAVGQATHDAIVAVLGASEQAGSLQRTLFRDIRDNLGALADALDAEDSESVYLRMRDLDASLHDLAGNARDFHGAVARLRREHDADPDRFLAYKHLLIDYLEQFLEHLMVQRSLVTDAITSVEARGVERLARLAAAGDDSAGLFTNTDLPTLWRTRWEGLVRWFRAAPGARAGADDLEAATTGAIRDLLALLRRVTESARRPITRASELVVLARWFRSLPDDTTAGELFDAAFGLGRPHHHALDSVVEADASPTRSWRDAPAVDVPVTLREHGRRAAPGRPAPVTDFGATKRRLLDEHRATRAARAEAAARLLARPIEDRVLSEPEMSLLLEILDRAAHQRAIHPDETHPPTAVVEGVRAELCDDPAGMRIRSGKGTLRLLTHRLRITSAAANSAAAGAVVAGAVS